MNMTPHDYLAGCRHRFGEANPDRMREPAWEWMVREGHNPYLAREAIGLVWEGGSSTHPEWCFTRLGMPSLELSDGRSLFIAGEHEDWYDPDFCIYNDVIVRHGGEVSIFGYPREVFPPTDFHTATLVGDEIWLVGSLGYAEGRGSAAQVLVLDSATYEVRRVWPVGLDPGWIGRHRAVLLTDGATIQISRGRVVSRGGDGEWSRKDNTGVFRLDTRTVSWSRLTDTSSWRRYGIEHGFFDGDETRWCTGEILRELGHRVERGPKPMDFRSEFENPRHVLWIGDVPVFVEVGSTELRVDIDGDVPEPDRRRLIEGLSMLLDSTGLTVTHVLEQDGNTP